MLAEGAGWCFWWFLVGLLEGRLALPWAAWRSNQLENLEVNDTWEDASRCCKLVWQPVVTELLPLGAQLGDRCGLACVICWLAYVTCAITGAVPPSHDQCYPGNLSHLPHAWCEQAAWCHKMLADAKSPFLGVMNSLPRVS